MAEMVRKIQGVTAKPLSIDTPDPAIAQAGLEAYDLARAGGKKPIINSISALRAGMFDLVQDSAFPADPVGLGERGRRPIETLPHGRGDLRRGQATGRAVPARCPGATNDDCIIDPGIAPMGSDSEGNFHRLIGAMEMIHADTSFAGFHASVGLSNFTVMLPPKRADGSPVKGPLESAFLTKAMPLGLDMVIGSVKRNYEKLSPDHPAMVCIEECLKLKGFDVLMRVREFYA